VAPRFTGGDQWCEIHRRVDVQRSLSADPGRFEKKKTSRPSERTEGLASLNSVFSSLTRTGGPNDPSCPCSLT
jgi:hypothetical protein